MEGIIEEFRRSIKERGLKYTLEREEILQEILIIDGHFDVVELFLRFKNKKSKISKASIYRTLALLQELGYVQEVYKQGGHAHYEVTLNKKPHIHFICIKCHKIEEIFDSRIEEIIKEREKQRGYKFLTYHLDAFGVCEACKGGGV